METPDFLVQDDVYENSVFTTREHQISARNSQGNSAESREEYAVAQVSQVLLGNSIFDPSRLHIKVEQSIDAADNAMDATDDENVAVEALRSLSDARPKQMGHQCPHCNVYETTQVDLEEHLIGCAKNPDYNTRTHHCPICKETFEKINELNNHLVCHASSRPHACRICGSLFLQKQDLHNHLVTHGITQSHQCKHCGQQFTRMSALSNHMKIHSYTAGRALVDKIGDTHELEDILTGNDDPELQAVNNTRQKLVLPSINNISLTGGAAWAINYESESYNGMNLSDINPNIPNLNDKPDERLTACAGGAGTSTANAQAHENLMLVDDVKDASLEGRRDQRPYKCDKCNKSFAREKAYINHINNVNNHFTCDRCDQHFPSERALEGHRRYCGNNATNTVKIPRVSFKGDRNLQGQMNGDGDRAAAFDKRYKHVCDICSKRFSTKQKLFRHVWIHRKKLHICEVCSESFEDQKRLDAHRKEKHPSAGPFDCAECGKSFCSRQGLWEHGRIHTKDMTYFRCEECDKTFTSRQGFLIHKRKHSDERPYGCKYCMKSFRDGGTLRKHERIHTGERPHACPVCSKTFNQKVVLREHVRWLHAHTAAENQDGLYACQLCASAFAEKDELSAHYMKHSDQLAQMAKVASKQNISSQVISAAKASKMEADASLICSTMVSCDVEINEEMASAQAQQGGASRGDATYFEMTRVPPDGAAAAPASANYKPKIKVKELLRSPDMKMECATEDEVSQFKQLNVECDLCGIWFKDKEELNCHVRIHI